MQKRLDGIRRGGLSFIGIWVCAAVFTFLSAGIAAPHNGEEHMLSQPDGSQVPVIILGDEFHATAQDRDGHTLVRDSAGWICYAELSADGSEYVSTGVHYTGAGRPPITTRKNLRINERAVREKRERNRNLLLNGEEELERGFHGKWRGNGGGRSDIQPAPEDTVRVVGLVLFIAFQNYPPPANSNFLRYADSAYNRPRFRGNGSVYDYFNDVSNGKMQYTNYISTWVTAPNTFEYYDAAENYGRVGELITSALNELNNHPQIADEIARQVTTVRRTGVNSNNPTALALNIHPIRSGQNWGNGIWSHRGYYRGSASVGGIRFYDYQFSGLGSSGTITSSSSVPLSTVVHENGHMLFGWPDLYPYVNGQRNFVGSYCIMGSNTNPPQPPNPYFRNLEGWIEVTDIANTNGIYTHEANSHTAFRYVRNSNESYFIEARRRTGRNSQLPGEGLIIWHIDTRGNNADYDASHSSSSRRIPRVAVIQANNASEAPRSSAPFRNGGSPSSGNTALSVTSTAFSKNTLPAARYHNYGATNSLWSGEYSNIDISDISASAATMTFKVGADGAAGNYYLTVENGFGSGIYPADTAVAITANTQANREFMRWTSSEITPEDVYASPTTVTTISANTSVTAHFARAYLLPGNVEADTFGLASEITSTSTSSTYGATGNRVARIQSTSEFAEYLINIEESGYYDLSYRLLTNSSSAGRFKIRDMTNGGITLDSVTVPTSTRTSLQTINGKTVFLEEGRSVWRLEPLSGNYSIDWFGAQMAPISVMHTSAKKEIIYGIKASRGGKVSFSVPNTGHVSVKMFDSRGRTAAVLHDGVKTPGVYNMNLTSVNLSQGFYIVRMKSGTYLKNVKIYYRK